MAIIGLSQEDDWGSGDRHGWLRLRKVSPAWNNAAEANTSCWTVLTWRKGWRIMAMCMVMSRDAHLDVQLSIPSAPREAIATDVLEETEHRTKALQLTVYDSDTLAQYLGLAYSVLESLEVSYARYGENHRLLVSERVGAWQRLGSLVSLKLQRVEIPWEWMTICTRLRCLHLCWSGFGEVALEPVMSRATMGEVFRGMTALEELSFEGNLDGEWEGPQFSLKNLRRLVLKVGGKSLRWILEEAVFPRLRSLEIELMDLHCRAEILGRMGEMMVGWGVGESSVRIGGSYTHCIVEVEVNYGEKGMCKLTSHLPLRLLLETACSIIDSWGLQNILSLEFSKTPEYMGCANGDWAALFRATKGVERVTMWIDSARQEWTFLLEALRESGLEGTWPGLRSLALKGPPHAAQLLEWWSWLTVPGQSEVAEMGCSVEDPHVLAWKEEVARWDTSDFSEPGNDGSWFWHSVTFHRDSTVAPWVVQD